MAEVKKLKTRDEIPQEHKWMVEKIYKNIDLWEKDFKTLKDMALEVTSYSGKLGDGKELLRYLKLDEKISRLAGKLAVYAHLRSDEDTANPTYQALRDKVYAYFAELKSMQSFFVPELLNLSEENVKKEVEKNLELKLYSFMIEDILKRKLHVLTKDKEELVAAVSDCLQAPDKIFSMLSDADMTFPIIKNENNNDIDLTEANYGSYIQSKDRRVRQEAFKGLFNTYNNFKNTFAASLTSSIKNFVFLSKTRNYKSALEASLKPNNIPLEVYDNTINTINNNLKSLHRYVKVKKKLLGFDEIHMYDCATRC